MTASGRLGPLVYDSRGYVRRFTPPAQPNTADQGNARQQFAAAAECVKHLNAKLSKEVQENQAPTGYRWSSWLIGQLLDDENTASLANSITTFGGLSTDQCNEWEGQAVSFDFSTVTIDYATDNNPTPGQLLFALARLMFKLGYTDGGTLLDLAPTADAWAAYICG